MSFDDQELSSQIRRHATRHAAPERLRASILTRIALAEAGRPAPPARLGSLRRRWFDFGSLALANFGWRTASLSFAIGLACALFVLPVVQDLGRPLGAELVADHVRALRTGPLTEVASTDRHTVKPWFQGRLDYAPPVFDFAAEGFVLKGGRVERVRGEAVATLAYARQRHMIDLFVWPSEATTLPVRSVSRGFNVLHWADGSMQFWAVSDVEGAELERFARLWQARAARP